MKRAAGIRIVTVLHVLMAMFMLLGVLATFALQGQLGWFLASCGVLLGVACGGLAEVKIMRRTSEVMIENARLATESWPHMIALLEDMERIAPERAEMFEVVRHEMAAQLEVSRRVADGRLPGARETLGLRRKDHES